MAVGPAGISSSAGRCPSGQRKQTVNLPAQPTGVRIPPGPLSRLPRRGPEQGSLGRSAVVISVRTNRESATFVAPVSRITGIVWASASMVYPIEAASAADGK